MNKIWIAPAIEEQTEIVAQLSTNGGTSSAGGGDDDWSKHLPC